MSTSEPSQEPRESQGSRTREELIDAFERFGYVVLEDLEEFELFDAYLSKYKIPTWTSTDPVTRQVTFHKRIMGTVEGFF